MFACRQLGPVLLSLICMPAIAAEDLDRELARARRYMERGKWEAAKEALLELLEDHRENADVWAKRADIERDIKQCTFGASYEAPEWSDLVSGELISYRESSSQIKLRYSREDLGDFERIAGGLFLHPMLFAGDYTIEVRGKSYPVLNRSRPPIMIACAEGDELISVSFGFQDHSEGTTKRWLPASIFALRGDEKFEIDMQETAPARSGKPFALKVAVSSSGVTAYYNGRKFMGGRRPRSGWGHAGVSQFPFEEIEISGKVEPAWLEGKADAVRQAAWETFERSYRPERHLPAWFREGPQASAAVKPEAPAIPGPEFANRESYAERVAQYLEAEQYDEGLYYVAEQVKDRLSEEAACYWGAQFRSAIHLYPEALRDCDRLLELAPDHTPTWMMKVDLLLLLQRHHEAAGALRALIDRRPAAVEAYEKLALLHLLHLSDPAAAERALGEAASKGVSSPTLEQLQLTLVKARRGPEWPERYSYTSTHYEIHSDISREKCIEASRVLESAYHTYSARIDPLRGRESKRFKVYLFAGREGYEAYARDVLGASLSHTAGLYSSALQQLLIWNLPEEQFRKTVRHEGFHQFLDQVMDGPPQWFNEGLAEYYELAEATERGKDIGAVNPDHLRLLRAKRKKLVPLSKLLHVTPAQFYAGDRSLHYAQSWAFVHFLQHGSRERQKLFDQLFESFQSDESTEAALRRVLKTIDSEALERDFLAHLDRLLGR